MLCNNKCFYGDSPATLRGRQKCCFFPTAEQIVDGVWWGWHLSCYPGDGWSSHGNTVGACEGKRTGVEHPAPPPQGRQEISHGNTEQALSEESGDLAGRRLNSGCDSLSPCCKHGPERASLGPHLLLHILPLLGAKLPRLMHQRWWVG